ncbi:MAG: dynamin family protein [Verrucomicrobiales bacterium]|nr:dynamin family protein [Verrucomicrobiales bacterium]
MNAQVEQTMERAAPSATRRAAPSAPTHERLDALLRSLSELAGELHLDALQPQLAACQRQLATRDGLDVAVFGRFKAGKSSFLNHLVGRPILPIGVVPLTAVVTRLRYGSSDRAEVRFANGTRRSIPLTEIELYVSEKENPDNTRQVESVEIELPELKPLAPLEFVDTPGLGSAFAHNTEATLRWLPQVGAALVAVSSDAPLSERDLRLLDDLRQYTPKIVLLLTKADLLTAPQRAEVLAFVREQMQKRFGASWPVFFYSIKPELAELKTALTERLFVPLIKHAGAASAEILRHKLAAVAKQGLSYLEIALASAAQSETARAALAEKLADERHQFDLLREELSVLAREWDAKAFEWALERLAPRRRAIEKKVADALHAQLDQWRLRLPALLDTYSEWLTNFLVEELRAVSASERATFCAPIEQVRLHLERTLRALQDRLGKHVKDALGLELAPREFQFEVREPAAPPVSVGVAFDVTLDLIGYLVPMTLFRALVHRRLVKHAQFEVRKNFSRLAAAWRERVSHAIEDLKQQAIHNAETELATLEQMLSQTKSDAPQLRAKHAALTALLQQATG